MKSLVTLMLASLLAACSSAANPPASEPGTGPAAGAPGTVQERFERESDVLYWALLDHTPATGVGLGHHQYDGKLPDISAEGIAARIAMLQQAEATLTALPPVELLRTSQIEHAVLLAHIRKQLFSLQVVEAHKKDPLFYIWALNLMSYITRDYAPLAERAQGIMGICDGAEAYVEQAMNNLQPALPRTWIKTALLQVNGMIDFVAADIKKEITGLDAALAGPVKQSLGRCTTALQSYKAFLDQRMKQATDDYAYGEETFLRMLRDQEGVDTTIARLQEIGQADFDRNLRALKEAAAAIAPGKPVTRVIADLAKEKLAADELLSVATGQAGDMRSFLIANKIVTIPYDDVAEVRESPPFMRWNSAFLSSAGQFETKSLPSFYYISPPDPSWPADVQKAYIPFANDLLFTTIHEVWPGHFLHSLHRKSNESRILKSFCSYSMSEGWAHYSEEMMWNQGAGGRDPRVHVGQLVNALMRNARFMSAIGLHTRGMTVEQSIDMFKNKAYLDHGTALQQATRGTFDPGYLNYTLGKLMILKLREDWKARAKSGYSLQAFHDAFLSYGCAPVPVIRRFMLGEDAGPAL